MTKQVDLVFKQWWPIFVWLLGLAFATGITINKLDNISMAIADIKADRKADLAAVGKLEAHICVLDTMHNMSCIKSN